MNSQEGGDLKTIPNDPTFSFISALDECEKAGKVCPSELLCLENENGTFACGCDVDSKVVGEGDARTCQGKNFSQYKGRHDISFSAYDLASFR